MTQPRAKRSIIASRSHLLKQFLSFRAAPAKFVPRSLMSVWGLPRLAINLVITIMHKSVSSPFTTPLCTAIVTKHLKQHRCFTSLPVKFLPMDRNNLVQCKWRGIQYPHLVFGQISLVPLKWLHYQPPTSDALGFDAAQCLS